MIRIAWSPSPELTKILAVCGPCSRLMGTKCELEGQPFYSGTSAGEQPCGLCGQHEIQLNSAS